MGVLAVTDFTSEILAGLGNRQNDASLSQQRIINVLNLAQSRLSRFYDFQEMSQILTTNCSQTGNQAIDKFVQLPTGVKTIHTLVLIDGNNSRKMKEKPWRMFDQKFPMPENVAPGWPSIYCRWGNSIITFPTPQQAFPVVGRFVVWPTPFNINSLSATSGFDNKDDILIAASLGYFWRSLGRLDYATFNENLAAALATEAKEREGTRPDMDASMAGMMEGDGVDLQYWNNPFISAVQ